VITQDFIAEQVRTGQYEVTEHAEDERFQDELRYAEIEEVLIGGKIIEQYPDDPRGASCLVAGETGAGKTIHVVCGKTKQNRLTIITVYVPKPPKWRTPFERGKK
jgi:hypothetical protein